MASSQNALVVGGRLQLLNTNFATPSFVDVSSEVSHVTLHANVNTVVIPATMGLPTGNRPGAASYAIEIHYVSTPGNTGVLFPILEAAIGTTVGVQFQVNLNSTGITSASNPQYSGTFVVTNADVGGDVGALSLGSSTYPLFTAWTKALV